MESPHRHDESTPPDPDLDPAVGSSPHSPTSVDRVTAGDETGRRSWTRAEADAEIERLGDVPFYDPDATAEHRPFDAEPAHPHRGSTTDSTGLRSASADVERAGATGGAEPGPANPVGAGTTATQRLSSYGWLFTDEPAPEGLRHPRPRQQDSDPELDGPPTAPLTPVGVTRVHPVANAVPRPATTPARPAATKQAAGRSADHRRRRGGRVGLTMLVLAICLSLGSAAAMVAFRLSEDGTSLASLVGLDEAGAPAAGKATPGEVWNGPLTPIDGVTAAASCIDPAGNDGGTAVPYEPMNLLDDDLATAWRCTADEAPSVTFQLPEDALIAEVGLVNGYAKDVGGLDRYPLYERAVLVRWTFADGTSVTQELADDTRTMQSMRVPVHKGGQVTLEILKVSNPSVQSATRDAMALSSVVFLAPAG